MNTSNIVYVKMQALQAHFFNCVRRKHTNDKKLGLDMSNYYRVHMITKCFAAI